MLSIYISISCRSILIYDSLSLSLSLSPPPPPQRYLFPVPSLPETPKDRPKKKSRGHGEENPDGGIVSVPPVGFVLLPQASRALVQEGLRMLSRKTKIRRSRRWLAQFLYQIDIFSAMIFQFYLAIHIQEFAGHFT